MIRLRRALHRIAITWLLCHAATLTLSPAVSLFGPAEELLECRCAHSDHATCPMHHKPAPGSETCLMRSAGDTGIAVFSWLMNAGPVPGPAQIFILDRQQLSWPTELPVASLRSAPPDPPPPRA